MTLEKIKSRISELCSHFLFEYNGKSCGIDPLDINTFDVWYGDEYTQQKSIDDVFKAQIFDGKCLNEIYCDIKVTSW